MGLFKTLGKDMGYMEKLTHTSIFKTIFQENEQR